MIGGFENYAYTYDAYLRAREGGGMKRQIICQDCRMDQIGKIKSYDGEWWKTVAGKAKPISMLCDNCGKAILPNEKVHAQSFGLDSHPYYEWEAQYIEVTA